MQIALLVDRLTLTDGSVRWCGRYGMRWSGYAVKQWRQWGIRYCGVISGNALVSGDQHQRDRNKSSPSHSCSIGVVLGEITGLGRALDKSWSSSDDCMERSGHRRPWSECRCGRRLGSGGCQRFSWDWHPIAAAVVAGNQDQHGGGDKKLTHLF
jgi:hypothetical protein